MDFSKLLIGHDETLDFAHLAVREGLITSFSTEFDYGDFSDELYEANNTRIKSKSSLLKLLLLFDNIDSNTLITYDLSRFIDNGIIQKDSQLSKYGIIDGKNISAEEILYKKIAAVDKKQNNEQAVQFIKGLVMNMDKEYGTDFFTDILDLEFEQLASCTKKSDEKGLKLLLLDKSELLSLYTKRLLDSEWFDNYLYKSNYILCKSQDIINALANKKACDNILKYLIGPALLYSQIVKKHSNLIIPECTELLNIIYSIENKKECRSCISNSLIYCSPFFECKNSLHRYVTFLDIWASRNFNIPLFSMCLKGNKFETLRLANVIDDVYYLFKLPALQQLGSLPTPSSIQELLRLRSRPEIKSFRSVFKSWCEQLLNYGDEKAIEQITKDFNRASELLYKKYSQQEKDRKVGTALLQNFLSLILEIPGYLIPFFGLLFGVSEPWIKRNNAIKTQSHEWFVLTK